MSPMHVTLKAGVTYPVACVAGGVRERGSDGGAAIFPRGHREGFREQLDSSPILSRLRHSRSRLRYQSKSTRTRNPASYALRLRYQSKSTRTRNPASYAGYLSWNFGNFRLDGLLFENSTISGFSKTFFRNFSVPFIHVLQISLFSAEWKVSKLVHLTP